MASFTPVGNANFDAKNQLEIQGSHYDLDGQQDAIGGYGFTYDGEVAAGTTYPAQDHLGSTRVVFDAAALLKPRQE